MERWRGKTALVTGAGAGIGAGVAAALAGAGLFVVALDIVDEAAIAANLKPSGQSVVARRCDVTDLGQLAKTFQWIDEEHGGVDILISCAGVLYPGQITDVGNSTLSVEQLSRMLDVNTKAVVMCARLAVASMKRRGVAGHIVNINSLAGHYVPATSQMNVYSATKYAITAFTEALNNELADFGSNIKTTSISPGITNSGLARTMLSKLGAEQARALQPSDVAGAVLYALSTPPHVNINELTITSVGEKKL